MAKLADVWVWGQTIDDQTRCVHWHSAVDVVAIEFACCRRFYPCRSCHDDDADHDAELWTTTQRDERAILCGVCGHRLRIAEYFDAGDTCPACGSDFNPGCRLHHHLYFE